MSRLAGGSAVLGVLVLVLLFTRWNGAERMTLDLGLWTFYRVPTTWVIFGAFLLGMAIMLVAGIHADLRVRRYLRERLAREGGDPMATPPPVVDRLQQDLFAGLPVVRDPVAVPTRSAETPQPQVPPPSPSDPATSQPAEASPSGPVTPLRPASSSLPHPAPPVLPPSPPDPGPP